MAKRTRVIGVTGNIGCGKSQVISLIANYHRVIPVNCDRIARHIIESPERADMMRGMFGSEVFTGNCLDTRAVATRLFADKTKRLEFEAIIHPLVWARVRRNIAEGFRSSVEFVLVESAILFESGIEDKFDEIVVVVCSDRERRRRLKEKRQMTDAEIEARIACQLPQEMKMARAHHLICTECDIQELYERTESLYAALLTSQRSHHRRR